MPDQPLAGQHAIVTGASSGIGQAIAVAFARAGAAVALFDRQEPATTLGLIEAAGGTAWPFVGDVSREADVLSLFDRARCRFDDRFDVCVNCAGIQIERKLADTTVADFDLVMNVNVKGTFLVGREAIRMMVAQPAGGRVINVASELAYLGRAEYSVYVASKSAILGLTRSWAREFAPGILVNALAPGPTDTPLLSLATMSPAILEKEKDVPLRRVGRPDEIASAALFLAGPGATFFTGQCLSPNGGAVMF